MTQTASLDALIDHLVAHRKQYPDHGNWPVELRDRIVALPPKQLTHDEHDKVVILAGIQAN